MDGRADQISVTRSLLTSSVFGLFAASAALVATAQGLVHFNQSSSVRVDIRSWDWLSAIQVKADHLPDSSLKLETAPKFVPLRIKHHRFLPHRMRIAPKVQVAVYEPPVEKPILVSEAHPVTGDPEIDAIRLREIQLSLSFRFSEAVAIQYAKVNTHLLKQPAKATPRVRVAVARAAVVRPKERPSIHGPNATPQILQRVVERTIASQPVAAPIAQVEQAPTEVLRPAQPREYPTSIGPEPPVTIASHPASRPRVQKVTPATQQNAPSAPSTSPGWITVDYSVLAKTFAQVTPTAMTTHPWVLTKSIQPHPLSVAPSKGGTPLRTMVDTQAVRAAPPVAPIPQAPSRAISPPAFVEAFNWTEGVAPTQVEQWTREEAVNQNTQGWSFAQAPDHWGTLYWHTGPESGIPLLSTNSALLLAKLAGANLESDSGIVFGKVPKGWSVDFTGRSERVMYMDERGASVNADNISADRFFAFLNAAPGAQLVYFNARRGLDSGAIGIPVLGGTATYIDLDPISRRTLSGFVLSAKANHPRPMAGVHVRFVGQATHTVVSNQKGEFLLSDILIAGGYPSFIETDSGDGYIHRYRVSAAQTDSLALFRLSPKQVQDWLSQLSGGISPESGLIVAAVPSLVASRDPEPLFPDIRTWISNPTLKPETYVLSPKGDLKEGASVSDDSPRFMGVQVPEGPAQVSLQDKGQRSVWSELVMVSPGVIDVVGPH